LLTDTKLSCNSKQEKTHKPPQLRTDPRHGLNVVVSARISQQLGVVLRLERAAERPN
jgi:hypothetical protein